MTGLITVLIADDDREFREALEDLIGGEPELELVGSARDAGEAIEMAVRLRPAIALIDVKMPAGGGARAASGIRERSPRTRIVAYSAYDERAIVLDMVRAGATSYLLKGAPASEVVSTIIRAAQGEGVLSPEITLGVVDALAEHMGRSERQRAAFNERAARIRHTIDGQRFSSVFQPIVDLNAGEAAGVEALSRFYDEPLQGPDRWFAEAEGVGLLSELELAAARSAVKRLTDAPHRGFMSLNFSPETLPRCRPLVVEAGGAHVVIEITEHAAIDDYDALRADVQALRAQGARLAVDDAGAGFASLRHTLQLTPDFIKLDISLTRGIDQDRSKRALAAGLIGFANELDADIIAEGIETEGEMETLRALGVRFGQGYYLGAPGELPLESDHFPAER